MGHKKTGAQLPFQLWVPQLRGVAVPDPWEILTLRTFRWDLLCNLTLQTFTGGPVKKPTLYYEYIHIYGVSPVQCIHIYRVYTVQLFHCVKK